MQWVILQAREGVDDHQISIVLREAFGSPGEAQLVEKLQLCDCFIPELSLVAVRNNQIVGYLLLTTIRINPNQGDSVQSLALAPMAVLPAYQQKGIGSALVNAALIKAIALGYRSIIVLGHANYYSRFGFRPASQWKIRSPFPAPDEAFMAIELADGSLKKVAGIVEYSAPFFELE
ncbi:MAG: N-acetyltransferase [Saprospiraceae bacterium]|nr:N-acetyltransferase [Saprospiraceae bacterium]